MKYLSILCLTMLLGGCGWMNRNSNENGTPNNNNGNNNGNTTPQETVKTSTMKDLFTYFDEQGLTYANAKDIDVVDVNAHEGKMM